MISDFLRSICVEHDKYLIQNIYSVNELEQAIAAINEEITKRKKAEL